MIKLFLFNFHWSFCHLSFLPLLISFQTFASLLFTANIAFYCRLIVRMMRKNLPFTTRFFIIVFIQPSSFDWVKVFLASASNILFFNKQGLSCSIFHLLAFLLNVGISFILKMNISWLQIFISGMFKANFDLIGSSLINSRSIRR